MTRSTSTPVLIGAGFLLFALGLLAGVHLPRPSISSRMNDDLNHDPYDDPNNDLNGRSLRRRLQYLDPRTVTIKPPNLSLHYDSPPNRASSATSNKFNNISCHFNNNHRSFNHSSQSPLPLDSTTIIITTIPSRQRNHEILTLAACVDVQKAWYPSHMRTKN